MNSLKLIQTLLISGTMTLALLIPTAAEAQPTFRARVSGVNPNTGNFGRISGGYRNATGSRFFRAGGYNPTTGTYQGGTRAFNPTTGQGFTSTTTGIRGQGLTSTINTLNNGSYVCTFSRGSRGQCLQQDLSL